MLCWIPQESVTESSTTIEDIALNFVWLRPLVEAFPDRVPSGFLICDVILMLNEFLMDKLLLPEDPNAELTKDDKIQMANEETNRMKKLLGALRYLWRNGSSTIMAVPGKILSWPQKPHLNHGDIVCMV